MRFPYDASRMFPNLVKTPVDPEAYREKVEKDLQRWNGGWSPSPDPIPVRFSSRIRKKKFEGKFPFTLLPWELRSQIYYHVLRDSWPTAFYVPRAVTRYNHPRELKVKDTPYILDSGRFLDAYFDNEEDVAYPAGRYCGRGALLRTCKAVYYETLPVLYAENILAFEDAYLMGAILHEMGPGRFFIRQINLGSIVFLGNILYEYLLPCKSIRTLHMDNWIWSLTCTQKWKRVKAKPEFFSDWVTRGGTEFFDMIRGREGHCDPLKVLEFDEPVCQEGNCYDCARPKSSTGLWTGEEVERFKNCLVANIEKSTNMVVGNCG